MAIKFEDKTRDGAVRPKPAASDPKPAVEPAPPKTPSPGAKRKGTR